MYTNRIKTTLMKKKKLNVEDLKVKSFTTSSEQKIKGGGTADWETCHPETQCDTKIAKFQ